MDHTVIQGLYRGEMQFPFFLKEQQTAFSALMMKEEHNRLVMMSYKPFFVLTNVLFLVFVLCTLPFWFSCKDTAHFLMFVHHKTMLCLSFVLLTLFYYSVPVLTHCRTTDQVYILFISLVHYVINQL